MFITENEIRSSWRQIYKLYTFLAHDNDYDVQECCDLDVLLHKIWAQSGKYDKIRMLEQWLSVHVLIFLSAFENVQVGVL